MIYYNIETTGLYVGEDAEANAEICKIEAIKCADNAIIGTFSTFVRCSNKIGATVREYVGITDEMLEKAPGVKDAISAFVDFVGEDKIAGYYVGFDLRFIEYYANEYVEFFKERFIDLFPLVEKTYGEQIRNFRFDESGGKKPLKSIVPKREKKNSLTVENVCKFFGIDSNFSAPEQLFLIAKKIGAQN